MDLHSLHGTLHYPLSLSLPSLTSCVCMCGMCALKSKGEMKRSHRVLVPCWCSFVGDWNNFCHCKKIEHFPFKRLSFKSGKSLWEQGTPLKTSLLG
jgi:hypothetical protein